MMMAGLRERKKEQTRRRIAEVALRLFDERGYDAVTVNEVAEAAGVAKVTLFAYFPTKECLVLDGMRDDTAGIVAARRAGQSPLDALREHYRAMAARGAEGVDVERLLARVRVVSATPALMAGVYQAHLGQRYELAAALTAASAADEPARADDADAFAEGEGLAAQIMAGQITTTLTTLREAFFQRLASGMTLEEAGRRLAADVELAFDLLENGLSGR